MNNKSPTRSTLLANKTISKSDFLWKTLGRYDSYVSTVNSKAAAMTAFNSFFVGTIILRWDVVGKAFESAPVSLIILVKIMMATSAIGALIALGLSFYAVLPYLFSEKAPGKYHSLIFFKHVSEFASGDDYKSKFETATDEDLLSDLAKQCFALAKGLDSKMNAIRRAGLVLVFGQLVPLSVLALSYYLYTEI